MKLYICNQIKQNLSIDGNLNKPEWLLATSDVLVDTVTGNPSRQNTEIKMLWSNEYLYVAFTCEDNYIYATMPHFNDSLWMEEVVEIFIDPSGDRTSYIEFNINPLNAHLHYHFFVKQNGIKQDGTDNELAYARNSDVLQSAIRIDKRANRWQAEIAIPLIELCGMPHIPPKHGDKVKINLYRIDRAKVPETRGTPLHESNDPIGLPAEDEYTAWSPTHAVQFHSLDHFGTLVFYET